MRDNKIKLNGEEGRCRCDRSQLKVCGYFILLSDHTGHGSATCLSVDHWSPILWYCTNPSLVSPPPPAPHYHPGEHNRLQIYVWVSLSLFHHREENLDNISESPPLCGRGDFIFLLYDIVRFIVGEYEQRTALVGNGPDSVFETSDLSC